MKKEIHSENYRYVVFRDTSNGEEFLTRSCAATKETTTYDGEEYPLYSLGISSSSHPFYTGKRQLIADRGGRIEQFRRRYNIKDSEGETGEDSAAAETASSGDAAES